MTTCNHLINHSTHFEVSPLELETALRQATWPTTADLIPPGEILDKAAWCEFYAERLQIGLLSLYPRTLTEPLPALNLSAQTLAESKGRLLELLLVPHWSHETPLRHGVHTRQQRLEVMMYSCCELALVHTLVAKLWPTNPPIIYAITHAAPANFLQKIGYHGLKLPANMTEIYRPCIRSLVERDVTNQGTIEQIRFVYAPPNTLAQIKQTLVSYVERITTTL